MDYKLEYPDISSERIDKYVSQQIQELSRSYVQQLLEGHKILVNNVECKSNYKCKPGDQITIFYEEPKELEVIAEDRSGNEITKSDLINFAPGKKENNYIVYGGKNPVVC